jgi:hypothetical protein
MNHPLKLDTKNNKRDREMSKEIRKACYMTGMPCPILWKDGFEPPRVIGHRGSHTTKTGKSVHFPNAYRKYGKTVYHPSSLKIVVGAGWICSKGL